MRITVAPDGTLPIDARRSTRHRHRLRATRISRCIAELFWAHPRNVVRALDPTTRTQVVFNPPMKRHSTRIPGIPAKRSPGQTIRTARAVDARLVDGVRRQRDGADHAGTREEAGRTPFRASIVDEPTSIRLGFEHTIPDGSRTINQDTANAGGSIASLTPTLPQHRTDEKPDWGKTRDDPRWDGLFEHFAAF